jgi:molecular chaperone DnaK
VTPPVIGIDLGTTNSVVAYCDESGTVTVITDENGARIIPSVVHIEQSGNVVVGRYARDYLKVEPERVARVFKRGMGTPTFLPDGEPFVVDGKTWTPELLSSLVLKKLREMAEAHFGEPVTQAVITVPHYFGEPERAATRSAGEIAGLEVLQIVNEPTAAAVAHGHDGDAEEGTLLVFDLGGGTFDVTLMRHGADGKMEVIATGGDRELGGTDFDAAIVARMAEQAGEQAGVDFTRTPVTQEEAAEIAATRAEATENAEQMKMELSARPQAGRQFAVAGKPVKFSLTREEFESLIAEQTRLVEDAILLTLDKVDLEGPDVTTALMVGGSSRIPLFQAMVEGIVGKKPELTKNLDEDVARGAALLAAKLGDTLDPRSELAQRPDPVDAASHALGVTLVHPEDRSRLINQVVIPEGTPIPHSSTHNLMTVDEGQTEVKLELNEGADEDLDFTRRLDESIGRFPNPVPRGHPLRFEIEYTADQLIKVHLYDGQSRQLLTELEVTHNGMLSEDERNAARDFLRRTDIE